MADAKRLTGEKILVTGATGMVAAPLLRALAPDNEVLGVARLTSPADVARLEALGVQPIPLDLAAGDYSKIPDDVTVVCNFAVHTRADRDFERQLVISAEATALLMARCKSARAFLQCSSNAVYQPAGARAVCETDELGDHHRPQYTTYSIGRIAGESVARAMGRALGVPTVIARLTVPYGNVWGFPARHLRMIAAGEAIPVHPDDPQWFTPLHEDDLVAQLPALIEAASVPALVVNWGGDEQVRMEEWCHLIGELLGIEPRFELSDAAFRGVRVDTSRRLALTGPCRVHWREGIRAMVAAAGKIPAPV